MSEERRTFKLAERKVFFSCSISLLVPDYSLKNFCQMIDYQRKLFLRLERQDKIQALFQTNSFTVILCILHHFEISRKTFQVLQQSETIFKDTHKALQWLAHMPRLIISLHLHSFLQNANGSLNETMCVPQENLLD